ncbi:phosphogluconate dehydrogenase (NAD(+)-dependent, decarboxylating) [Euzebya rosea]|uniref:phosphogluconate dehydrogenase (NAD(+)-dependent, decarboxylating) n=1 Tax=Euzebya rosea TaxID=2052804 RepID=UPI000D3E5CE0|nr:decarboxylating 6-phosphogluconate dehydrogenase [Euzebya rosea]
MQIGMVGLGKMGGNMTVRLLRGGHDVVAHDVSAEAVASAAEAGATGVDSLEALVAAMPAPRVVWVMVPSGEITERTVRTLGTLMDAGDVVVDGGNSRFSDSVALAESLAEDGVLMVDAGTSGGIWGLDEGYCLMVGGTDEAIERLSPALETLAPPDGWAHVGPVGAGHYVKMIHNGVEYAMMQAYAEGFELLAAGDFGIDLHQVAEVWRHGSVVRSWLLDLTARALDADPGLEQLDAWVPDSGEGRWTVQTAVDLAVPAPTIAAALFNRFASREDNAFGQRLLAALRNQFGGHAVKAAGPSEGPADG